MKSWDHSVWYGTQYGTASGRTVRCAPSWIFSCPLCEYRMTAADGEGIRTVRWLHARTAHPRAMPAVNRLHAQTLPAHLAAKR